MKKQAKKRIENILFSLFLISVPFAIVVVVHALFLIGFAEEVFPVWLLFFSFPFVLFGVFYLLFYIVNLLFYSVDVRK